VIENYRFDLIEVSVEIESIAVKFGVVVFPAQTAIAMSPMSPVTCNQPTRMVWHEETDISDLDVVVIPGGFSYGRLSTLWCDRSFFSCNAARCGTLSRKNLFWASATVFRY